MTQILSNKNNRKDMYFKTAHNATLIMTEFVRYRYTHPTTLSYWYTSCCLLMPSRNDCVRQFSRTLQLYLIIKHTPRYINYSGDNAISFFKYNISKYIFKNYNNKNII